MDFLQQIIDIFLEELDDLLQVFFTELLMLIDDMLFLLFNIF